MQCVPCRDSVLVLHVHSMQRDPDVWPQPEAFLPQRYLPEGQAALGPADPNGWAPFGVGARMCVGHKLAMMVSVRVWGCVRMWACVSKTAQGNPRGEKQTRSVVQRHSSHARDTLLTHAPHTRPPPTLQLYLPTTSLLN